MMIHNGVKPDETSFSSVLSGLAFSTNLKWGMQVHAQLLKYVHGNDISVGDSLVDMYFKNRYVFGGANAFYEMPCKDVVSWTNIASGYLYCNRPRAALMTIENMKNAGWKPNKLTLAISSRAWFSMKSLEEGKMIHCLKIKFGNVVDEHYALLEIYVDYGYIREALSIFSLINKTAISWTTMIRGLALGGDAIEVLEFFERMIDENVKPNYSTFVWVLYSHIKNYWVDLDDLVICIAAMKKEYFISPGEDHYACFLVWETLIGASPEHENLEIWKLAAERGRVLHKKYPFAYELSADMFTKDDGMHKINVM
ncbi:hypothetical protein GIB67_035062 [Kingdonia uniflora]|uniref:Pentatricopeptide repeat-containing protein n=1 Tax=Kingdonia uniflora TaxID=39325 RepID=A0A7J7L1L7_9MAGN|nr:hypothetical protein GIB67_035062 [Kingdonia uniflora]